MSNTLRFTLRSAHFCFKKDLISCLSFPHTTRFLYSKAALGVDAFTDHKQVIKEQMHNIEEKFRERMNVYAAPDSNSMIFTEDLKNMVHLAETDEDFDLVIRMAKKFNNQNKQLRFGSFVFGPVVMRMFYLHNQPDKALECFTSPELDGLFDQLITYQILLDILFENKKYQEMLDVFETIKNKQIQGAKYPRNAVVLVMAACYKINSVKSFEIASKLWNDLVSAGYMPMRRATTFFAGLAIQVGHPEVALEVASSVKKQNYVTIRNLKALALAQLGRLDESITILKSVLAEDAPSNVTQTFNRDVLVSIKEIVEKSENAEVTLEFNKLWQLFEKEGHVSEQTLDTLLCSEIQLSLPRRDDNFNKFSDNRGKQRMQGRFARRPGLKDLN